MGYGASGDRPLRNDGAFFEVHNGYMALPRDDISHGDVQSFCGCIDCHARGVATRQTDTAHQSGGPCIHNVDRSTAGCVIAAAPRLNLFRTGEDFDGRVKEVCAWIIGGVIPSFIRISICRQFNGFTYVVASAVDGHNAAIGKRQPDLVCVWDIKEFYWHSWEPRRLVDYFAGAEVHHQNAPRCLPGNKQALTFDVNC